MPSSLWESYQRPLGPHPSPVCERFCGHWWLTANSCILLWPTTISPTDAWEVTSCPPAPAPQEQLIPSSLRAHTIVRPLEATCVWCWSLPSSPHDRPETTSLPGSSPALNEQGSLTPSS